MTDDYKHIVMKDPHDVPKYAATGLPVNMIANRISWFYDFLGPSINMDSACSSSLMAFDVACQGLRNRDADMVWYRMPKLKLNSDYILVRQSWQARV